MKLESVRIENYRAIDQLRLRLHPRVTVLHGPNAQGKTSVMSAVATGLDAIPALLAGASGIGIAKEDRRDGRRTSISLVSTDGVEWECASGVDRARRSETERHRCGRPQAGLAALQKWIERTVPEDADGPVDLPISVFYSSGRTVPRFAKRRIPPRRPPSRHAALVGALSAETGFRELFEWLRSTEDEELGEGRAPTARDPRRRELAAVRTAILSMADGFAGMDAGLRPFRESVNGRTAARALARMSGGQQALLVVAADMAWRMARTNPHRANPLDSEAICLIDEIELHLHPSWHQRVVDAFTRTFPTTQFVVATNSPLVLTTVQPDRIVELCRVAGRIRATRALDATFGAEAGAVLATVMGVGERPADNLFARALNEYASLVSAGRGETEEAKSLRRRLERLSPRDPAFDRADVEIRRRRVAREWRKAN